MTCTINLYQPPARTILVDSVTVAVPKYPNYPNGGFKYPKAVHVTIGDGLLCGFEQDGMVTDVTRADATCAACLKGLRAIVRGAA